MATALDHQTVLLNEAVDALVTDKDGIYVDCTFGRGGHSREVLKRLSSAGRLIGFDKDPLAVVAGEKLAAKDDRFSIVYGSFAELEQQLSSLSLDGRVNGILMDLGVSSPQLDDASRGFSFMGDGPLDMRMNNQAGQTAAQWLNQAPAEEIATVLKEYGEERFAKRIAAAIVERRQDKPLATTLELAQLVDQASPRKEKGKHPATRSFQAIRIFINGELDELREVLQQSLQALCKGGRLVVISFHSLEDRMVKQFIRQKEKGEQLPRNLPVQDHMVNRELRSVGKAVKASEEEVQSNIRSRSAIMRVAEKLV